MKCLQRLVVGVQRFGVPMQSRVQAAQGVHVVALRVHLLALCMNA
jgi:hypothetical protein